MPQGAPEPPPESIVLATFAGVRNNVTPERLKQGDLELGINVDIDDAGQLRRRRGYTKKIAEPCHSVTTIDGTTLLVKSGVLGILYPDYSFQPLIEVGPAPLCYVRIGDTIYFSSAITSGKVVNGAAVPWGAAVEDRWVSPVTRPGPTLGQVGGRLLGGVPNANVMESYKGRIYLGFEQLLWATELYQYDLVDKTKNFLQFENDLTMIAAVSDGLYVGTTAQLLFLQGTFSKGLTITEVLPEGVLPGSIVRVPYAKAMPQARGGNPVAEGYGPMFLSTTGVVLGLDGGQAYNLTQDRIVVPGAVGAAAVYREDQGVNSYLAVIDSDGGPATNARIGDYVDAEIVRNYAYTPSANAKSTLALVIDNAVIGDSAIAEIAGAGQNDEGGFGFVDYSDLDAPKPLMLPSGVATVVTRNLAPNPSNLQLKGPFYGFDFWDGTKFTPRALDDVISISLQMNITPLLIGGTLTIALMAGTFNIAPMTYVFTAPVGSTENIRLEVRIAVRPMFLAQGAQLMLTPSVPCILTEFSPEVYPESVA